MNARFGHLKKLRLVVDSNLILHHILGDEQDF
jgi:hypothetical protein